VRFTNWQRLSNDSRLKYLREPLRDYAKIGPQFWIGSTGKKLREFGTEATIVAFYLLSNPHANMLGLYYLPKLYIAHETPLGPEGASKGYRCGVLRVRRGF
jgi:hypothetical protein